MYSLVHHTIRNARNIFLTSHKNCPDAVGSLCALTGFLKSQGKRVYPYLAEPVPYHLRELPWSELITTQTPALHEHDLYLVVDAGDLKQTGLEKELLPFTDKHAPHPLINIDHHKTNERFGHINIVDTEASSTCEMIYLLLHEGRVFIDNHIARCLLTGIVGDTGNFTNGATNKHAFQIAADLILSGANIFQVIRTVLSVEESVNTLRLFGRIFERLTYNPRYGIAISYVLRSDLCDFGGGGEAVEVIANILNYIRGIKAGIFIKENENGTFKVSLRTTHQGIDVSRLAKMLGGGGHKKAAGFTVKELGISLEEIACSN